MRIQVSVIIPTYNSAKYISEAIESVLNQIYKDYEIIVVDDGSTDNTNEIIEKFIKRYPDKIRYFYQKNKGPSAARNMGMKNANGEYIAFLDADDLWLPKKLEYQIHLMLKLPTIGLLGCGVYFIDEFGNIMTEIKGNNYATRELLLKDMMIRNRISGSSSSAVIQRKCFNKVGLFDETLRGSEDRDMWFRIAKFYEVKFLEEPLVKIRIHKNNAHKNTPMMKFGQKRFIYKNLSNVGWMQRKKAYSYVYLDAAREYYDIPKRMLAAINAFMAIIEYPVKIYPNDDKYQIFIKSLLPNSLSLMLKRIKSIEKK